MTGRFLFADADRPTFRQIERRRQRDIAFLERVRAAEVDELEQLKREYMTGPDWRRVAVERALARRGAR